MSAASILVIGRSGQLSSALVERAGHHGLRLDLVGRPELDLLDESEIRQIVGRSGATVIINAAAYTSVDRAEDEPELAHRVNAIAPLVLAETARKTGARLIHISTDYVFDGAGERPWKESDPTSPTTVYGQTKLDGERGVREALRDHVILRTAWVYSPFGRNFVRTMIELARTRSMIEVVSDQRGNPSCALDLADGIFAVLSAWQDDPHRGLGATYHLAGTGSISWSDFAREIFALSRAAGGPFASIRNITASEWPAKARRPLNSRLECSLFTRTFGYRMPRWRDSLPQIVSRILEFGGQARKV